VNHLKALALLVLMALLGCAHLLVRDHYHLINYDGFYFHFIAHQILEGTSIPLIGSGLAYPLAVLGHVVGLEAASLMIPPLLGIATGLVLYWGVTKLYSTKIALLAVVCFVFAQIPRLFYLSGNLDRDGLHLLVMTTGILGLGVFFKTQDKKYLILALASIPVLVWEWGLFGMVQYIPALLFIVLVVDKYRWDNEWYWLGTGLLAVGWFCLGRVVMEVSIFRSVAIVELGPLDVQTVIQYATLAVPLAFGLKRSDGFCMSWFLGFILMGFFASRLSVYAVAPACIIGAVGLETLWAKRSEWRYVFVAGCLIFLSLCWMVPKNMAMPNDWHDALVWVKGNTDPDAEIATWWSYGWWVMDVGDRTPSATQATDDQVDDLAALYFAHSGQQAQAIMAAHDWDYVVMSAREENFMEAIKARACVAKDYRWPEFYAQVMDGQIPAVYRNQSVVVLKVPVPY
jgi:hypothetical protein